MWKNCGFCHKSIKLGTAKEYTNLTNFRYGANSKSDPGYHGDHLYAAITETHQFVHISGIRHSIITKNVSIPIFTRSKITKMIYNNMYGAYCCHGNCLKPSLSQFIYRHMCISQSPDIVSNKQGVYAHMSMIRVNLEWNSLVCIRNTVVMATTSCRRYRTLQTAIYQAA